MPLIKSRFLIAVRILQHHNVSPIVDQVTNWLSHCLYTLYELSTGYNIPYYQDKYFGTSYYMIPNNILAIQQEIMFFGPVTLGFDVFDDLLNYNSGE